jgi:hypothetical protein
VVQADPREVHSDSTGPSSGGVTRAA